RSARKPILIAGGIGITPVLSMAQALRARGAAFELHYFVRSDAHVPFRKRLDAIESAVHLYKGLDAPATETALSDIVRSHAPGDIDVYVCGPGPMINMVKELALQHGMDEDSIRFEYFENATVSREGDPFEVSLARSGKTLTVPE